jgi:hypothetical protein
MIKKTFITAFILFACYGTVVMLIGEKWEGTQHLWQANNSKAQKFMYDETDTLQILILGSSLSTRIRTELIPGAYNLSLAGRSVFDGLRLLGLRKHLPHTIFIEMNMILRPANADFISGLTNPFPFYTKRSLPFFRDHKQPLVLLGTVMDEKIVSPVLSGIKRFISSRNIGEPDTLVLSKVLEREIKNYSKGPNKIQLDQAFNSLAKEVADLEKKGVTVGFFEMPLHESLCNLPYYKTIRETFYSRFPKEKYNYIDQPPCGEYLTTDALHLRPEEAMRYTQYFISMIKK